jgi:hypothetical protein
LFCLPIRRIVQIALSLLLLAAGLFAQSTPPPEVMPLYEQLKAFRLAPTSVAVKDLQLRQGPVEMLFTGEFYPARLASGQVYGAVFIGEGKLHAVPWSDFEKQSVQRFLKSNEVTASFTRAVLRFTDPASANLGAVEGKSSARSEAQALADAYEPRLLRETGLHLSARMAEAIANQEEQAGIFIAEFSGGSQRRFGLVVDHQCRTMENVFGLDAGEKGVLYQYKESEFSNDIWMAFFDDQDLARHAVAYSDAFDQVRIAAYRMEVDLRAAPHRLAVDAEMDMTALRDGIRMVDFKLNDGLPSFDNERLKHGARLTGVSLKDGPDLQYLQDGWDTAVWIVLPKPLHRDERLTLKMKFETKGGFFTWGGDFHYPVVTTSWYPRHHDMELSDYDLTFLHKPNTTVVSVGGLAGDPVRRGDTMVTRWKTALPLWVATFALGPFQRQSENIKIGDKEITLDYFAAGTNYTYIKKDFMLAEMGNTLKYFSAMFGDYRFSRLGAVFSPRPFGQGLPTLLLLPSSGTDHVWDFQFIAHEASHQWWGDMVGWRSYRDQWLSEGFADYSGVLYTAFRLKPKDGTELLDRMRRRLLGPPYTDLGLAAGKLYEVGPLIYGYRLSTRLTRNAYSTLIYSKGALTLRMLHFLMTDPSTGDGTAFFDLMKEFTTTYRGRLASTDNFFRIANQYFSRSAIARRYGLQDLDWFQREWVYGTEMPTYRLEYHFEPRPGGGQFLVGTLFQEGVPDNWFMPLPLFAEMENGQRAIVIVAAKGPSTPLKLGIPGTPKRIELDPDLWVLSAKTSAHKK